MDAGASPRVEVGVFFCDYAYTLGRSNSIASVNQTQHLPFLFLRVSSLELLRKNNCSVSSEGKESEPPIHPWVLSACLPEFPVHVECPDNTASQPTFPKRQNAHPNASQ